jgi:serine/threonine protein kinase
MFKTTDVWSFGIMLSEAMFNTCKFQTNCVGVKNIWDINESFLRERVASKKVIACFERFRYAAPSTQPSRFPTMSRSMFETICELLANMLQIKPEKRATSQHVWETLVRLHKQQVAREHEVGDCAPASE